jgi:O-acetyl-ADP-ribose deacetylase
MKISIIQGDITQINADAIVNAAHPTLLGGGGVDGAIHRVAGPELFKECAQIRNNQYPEGLPIGEAVLTKAYGLPAKFIIHTVGPRYYSEDADLLKNCYLNALRLAEEEGCETIAFPAISTGAYGCPIEKSAEIVKEVLESYESDVIKEIILVLFGVEDLRVYERVLGTKNL